MQRHLTSQTAAPGSAIIALLGHAMTALARLRQAPRVPPSPHLQHDIGLIDERPAEDDRPAAREAAMQLLRSI